MAWFRGFAVLAALASSVAVPLSAQDDTGQPDRQSARLAWTPHLGKTPATFGGVDIHSPYGGLDVEHAKLEYVVAWAESVLPVMEKSSLPVGVAFRWDVAPETLAGLPDLDEDFGLVLQGKITAEHIRALGHFRRLRWLRIQTDVVPGDTELGALGALRDLQGLAFSYPVGNQPVPPPPPDAGATFEGLRSLEQLSRLTSLSLGIPLTDSPFESVSKLGGLRRLGLGAPWMKFENVAHLNRLRKLEFLALSAPQLTDRELETLTLASLKGLALGHKSAQWPSSFPRKLTGTGLRTLERPGELLYLNLAGGSTSDEGLAEVARFTRLRRLSLSGHDFTDQGLRRLAPLGELRELWLANTAVTGAGFDQLHNLKRLESIVLSYAATDEGLDAIGKLPSLTRLRITSNQITDLGLARIARMPLLSELFLSGMSMSDAGCAELAKLPELTKCELWRMPVTDAGIAKLADSRKLQELRIGETDVTDAGLKSLGRIATLRKLELPSRISREGAERLYAVLPQCAITFGPGSRAERAARSATQKPARLPQTEIESWQKAGATPGWMTVSEEGEFSFRENADKLAATAVPGFRISAWKPGILKSAAVPTAEFSLDLSGVRVSDAVIKELSAFAKLRTLNLSGTQVSGLKGLSRLQGLDSLDLAKTRVTTIGLKEVAALLSVAQ